MCRWDTQARRDRKGLTASAPTPDQMERDEHHTPTSLPAPTKNTSIMQVRLPPHTHQPPRRNTTLTPTIVSLLPLPLLPPPSVFLLLRRLRRPLFLGLPRPTVRACIRPVPLSPVHTGLLAGRRGGAERAAAREAPQTLRGGKRADRPFRQAARAEVRVRIAQRAPRHALAHARGADPVIFTTPHMNDEPSAPPVAHVAHHPASSVTSPHHPPHPLRCGCASGGTSSASR